MHNIDIFVWVPRTAATLEQFNHDRALAGYPAPEWSAVCWRKLASGKGWIFALEHISRISAILAPLDQPIPSQITS